MKQLLVATVVSAWVFGACGPGDGTPEKAREQAPGVQRQPLTLPAEVLLPTEVAEGGYAAGNVDSVSGVSPDGQATYTIPLWVPAGRASIQPDLSLRYVGNGGNGPLGMGWSLSGTSRITRCRRTVVQDGAAEPVTFTAADAFCLDGQRLVAVQGAYGAAGTEYRTEMDSFAKVVSLDTDAMGPAFFRVYLKDGKVLTYGQLNGSTFTGERIRVAPAGDTDFSTTRDGLAHRYAWALARMEDRSGNFLSLHYTVEDDAAHSGYEHLLTRMEYTGSSMGAGAPPKRFVSFEYEARPDASTQFVSGFKLRTRKRLKALRMHGPRPDAPGLLRSYVFTYFQATFHGSSELRTVSECDGSGVCKRPLAFLYSQPGLTLSEIDTGATDLTDHAGVSSDRDIWILQPADVDGDGRDDLVYRKATGTYDASNGAAFFKWVVRQTLPSGTGVGAPMDLALPVTCASPMEGENGRWFDLNADGRTDVSIVQKFGCGPPPPRQLNNYLGGSGGFAQQGTGEAGDVRFADLEGDGAVEVLQVLYQPTGLPQLSYRPNAGGVLQSFLPVNASLWSDNIGFTLDLNASGRMSLLITDKTGVVSPVGQRYWAVEKRNGVFTKQETTLVRTDVNEKVYVFADVNGDGLPDALRSPLAGGDIEILLNTGNGFAAPVAQNLPDFAKPSDWSKDNGVRVLDYDLDGREDLMLMDARPGLQSPVVLLARDTGLSPYVPPMPVGRTTPAGYVLSQVLDVNGDGMTDMAQVVNGTLRIYKRTGPMPGLLVRAEDGLGAVTTFLYKTLSDATVYQPGTGCGLSRACVRKGRWVVSEHRVDAGEGQPARAKQFFYQDGRVDLAGRGWLGFATVVTTDVQTGAVMRTEYDHQTKVGTHYPRAMKPVHETMELVDNGWRTVRERSLVYRSTTRPGTDGVSKVVTLLPSTARETELVHAQGAPTTSGFSRTTDTTWQYDDLYGNLLSKTQQTLGGDEGSWSATYSNTPSTWLVGLPTRVQEESTVGGVSTTRARRLEYAPGTGLLDREIIETGEAQTELTTTFVRDADGVVSQVKREAPGLPARITTYGHDPVDRTTPAWMTNAAGHTVEYAYHAGLGVLAASVDENGVRTEWKYDGWGRLRKEDGPTDADTTVSYTHDDVPGQVFQVHARMAGGQETWTGYDRLGRAVSSRSRGFDTNAFVDISQVYNGLGQLAEVRTPNPRGGTRPVTTAYQYDLLGRTVRVTKPDGNTLITSYEGRPEGIWTRTVDEKGNVRRLLVDANGRTVRSEDEKQPGVVVATTYEYGPFGLLRRSLDEDGNAVVMEYDRWGRSTRQVDPDSGEDITRYNAFGDVVETRDGNGDVTVYEPDVLGRVVHLTGPDGESVFQWDQGAHSLGRLTGSTRKGDPTTTLDDISVVHTFDALGRPSTETWSVGGPGGTAPQVHVFEQSYDATYGRPLQVTYPDVNGHRLKVEYGYTDWSGRLNVVKEPGASGRVYWRADAVTPSGQLAQETYGNGVVTRRLYDVQGRLRFIDSKLQPGGTPIQGLAYTYEANGNLRGRFDRLSKTSEDFAYDALDRLTRWTVTQACRTSVLEYGYDDLGNLLSRTVPQGTGVAGTYTYGAGTAGPHAVTGSSEGTYHYDDAGNQVEAPGRQVQYTGFRLPASVTDGALTVSFRYDAHNRRTVKTGSDGSVTMYLGGLYERRKAPDGTVTHMFQVMGARRSVAQVQWKEVGATVEEQWLYLHPDHLGSVETVTDATGAVVGRSKYEPFGQRRRPDDLTVPQTAVSGTVRNGFTGHEHDDELRLINMRGRMYDPQLGHFLSPDPFVQAPLFSQSFNRYSYVFNNPLRFTDPSGFVATERVWYYDSWYGGWVSRDMAGGTPASSRSPDIGQGGGFFEHMPGYDVPFHTTPSATPETGSDNSGWGGSGSAQNNETVVRAPRYDPGTDSIEASLLYYRLTQFFAGTTMGVSAGLLPFGYMLPLPENMSREGRLGFGVGMGAASLYELYQGLSAIIGGVSAMTGGAGGTVATGGLAAVLGIPLALAGAASVTVGGVMVVDAGGKGAKALDILMMSNETEGSGGGDKYKELVDKLDATGVKPTQRADETSAKKVQNFIEKMKSPKWNWNGGRKIVIDEQGRIIDGHHRFLAAQIQGIPIPENAICRVPSRMFHFEDALPASWSETLPPGLF
ncbi:RHS repeat-associated core domain-containing protein [Pyxidicoccus sp. MSG2]|uniref:RHS repeat-associated core domain-containing protein n=1 Tax=Pyxidicoccus sp. MSG2 TaxID=2996790 RepID=UPI00226E2546|nr:RHS repeat-associated core domain-containing protein [Pyxidicoccus sp. MSG2]MCY1020499.1 FG-GAP-like repeat-containing protein [Pyxidicoccus sp. MSG2]